MSIRSRMPKEVCSYITDVEVVNSESSDAAQNIQFVPANRLDYQNDEKHLENYLLQNFDIQPRSNSRLPPMVPGTKNFADSHHQLEISHGCSSSANLQRNEDLVTYTLHKHNQELLPEATFTILFAIAHLRIVIFRIFKNLMKSTFFTLCG